MKKRILVFIVIFIILISIGTCLILFLNHENKSYRYDELINLGYSKSDIKVIDGKLNNNDIDTILNNKYLSNLKEFIIDKNFNIKYLNDYIKMSLSTNLDIKDVIYVINNNYYKEDITYDDFAIKIIKGEYFISDNLKRYVAYHNKYSDKDFNEVIKCVNSNLDYDFYSNDMTADISKGNLILVNKFYKLSSDYIPSNLVTIDSKYGNSRQMVKDAYDAFVKMFDAARNEGLHFYAASPYRSYSYQNTLYNNYVRSDGKKNADTYSARPGYSEHQTGLAVDVVSTTNNSMDKFDQTKEYTWLIKNAHNYGFILRYPKGKEYITGYMYESWHYRYVGIEAAKKIYEKNLTFEEYYAYYVK